MDATSRRLVCALLGCLATLPDALRADETFELLPVGHTAPASPPSPTGEYCSIFQTWTSVNAPKQRALYEWLIDPWGFDEAASSELERHHENRLRNLGDKMRETFGSTEDPLQSLWQEMRAKSDPAGKYRIRQTLSQSSLYSKAKIDLPDGSTQADPYAQKNWKAEQMMRLALPVWEQAFVFGQFNSNADSFQYRELTATAKTGLGVRWEPLPKAEVLVRGGPMVAYLDTNTSRLPEKSRLAVDVLATIPLWGQYELQYTGGAFAATAPNDQNLINQDLRIARQLSNNSEIYLGAKQQLDSNYSSTLWNNKRQLYIGIELKR